MITVGLDFGTHQTKVCIEDKEGVELNYSFMKFFDAYRIDHVLGFFRIWEIPVDAVHGLLGQFAPSLGMTADEIRSYGFNFQEKRFTEPFITGSSGKHAA